MFSEAPLRRISPRKCPGGKVGGQKPTLRGQGDNLFQFLVKLQRQPLLLCHQHCSHTIYHHHHTRLIADSFQPKNFNAIPMKVLQFLTAVAKQSHNYFLTLKSKIWFDLSLLGLFITNF